MIKTVWDEIPEYYPGIDTDEFVVMPNHIHGIITVGAGPRACPVENGRNNKNGYHDNIGHPRGGAPTTGERHEQSRGDGHAVLSLPDVVHRFKTLTTKWYIDGVKQNGWPPFPGKLWQRNYWEHIIRNEKEWNRIREYIRNNPAQWAADKLYPGGGPILKESPASYGKEAWMV